MNTETSLTIILRIARSIAELAKIRRYSERLSRIIVLLFNTLMTKHNILRLLGKKLGKVSFFSATHKITYIAGYLLSTHGKYYARCDHISTLSQCLDITVLEGRYRCWELISALTFNLSKMRITHLT